MSKSMEKAENVLDNYSKKIRTEKCMVYTKTYVPDKVLKSALKKYAKDLNKDEVIGVIDTSLSKNGKTGAVFSISKLYYSDILSKPKKIWFDEISKISFVDNSRDSSIKYLLFTLKNDQQLTWMESSFNTKYMKAFIEEMILLNKVNLSSNEDISIKDSKLDQFGALAVGATTATYGTANKIFDEAKFHANQGHGFAAENANHFYDRALGKNVKIVGADNVKDGADRLLNNKDGTQIWIQSKYYQTGKGAIDACFNESGTFRYLDSFGKPMVIEVPSDKYIEAVEIMKNKINQGRVPGVSNPNEAQNLVKKGNVTYKQAQNIAKAGNIDSLTYDALNGVIISASAFGVSATVAFATSIWNNEELDIALKNATYSGLKVGGSAFVTSVLASQLARSGLNSALMASSQNLTKAMGYKANAVLVNAFRTGKNIHGAAAASSAAKLLRGNIITAGATVVVFSAFDLSEIFRGRISGKQLFSNITTTTASIGGGTAGWLGGAAFGSMIMPGAGSLVGGLLGSVVGGGAAGGVTNAVIKNFVEEDADEMISIIEEEFKVLAQEYLLNKNEVEKITDRLSEVLSAGKLKEMFATKDQRVFSKDMLTEIIESIILSREKVYTPTQAQMQKSVVDVLEKAYDDLDPEVVKEAGFTYAN